MKASYEDCTYYGMRDGTTTNLTYSNEGFQIQRAGTYSFDGKKLTMKCTVPGYLDDMLGRKRTWSSYEETEFLVTMEDVKGATVFGREFPSYKGIKLQPSTLQPQDETEPLYKDLWQFEKVPVSFADQFGSLRINCECILHTEINKNGDVTEDERIGIGSYSFKKSNITMTQNGYQTHVVALDKVNDENYHELTFDIVQKSNENGHDDYVISNLKYQNRLYGKSKQTDSEETRNEVFVWKVDQIPIDYETSKSEDYLYFICNQKNKASVSCDYSYDYMYEDSERSNSTNIKGNLAPEKEYRISLIMSPYEE